MLASLIRRGRRSGARRLIEVGDRGDQVAGLEFVPGDRVEHQLAVRQLPHERRRQSVRLAEHDDQVGLAVGRAVQRLGDRRLVDRLVGREAAHRLGEALAAVTARIDRDVAAADPAFPAFEVDRLERRARTPGASGTTHPPPSATAAELRRPADRPAIAAEPFPFAEGAADDHDVAQQLPRRLDARGGRHERRRHRPILPRHLDDQRLASVGAP